MKIAIRTIITICLLFVSVTVFAQSEAQLQAELERVEREVREQAAIVEQKKAQTSQIQTQVNQLTNQVNQVQRNIDVKNSVIREIGSDISIKDQTVNQLDTKLGRSTDVLAELIRAKSKMDEVSLVEVLFMHENISEFFVTADSVITVKKSIYDLLGQIRELRGLTEEEKIKLEEKQLREEEIKAQIELEKKQVEVKRTQEQSSLATAKAIEQTEAQKLAEKQARANEIRTALFQLRDTGDLTFEQAMTFAESASKATGVRTAFILGILKQETNIGQYLGSCVITDLTSASMRNVKTGAVYTDGIHPTRDLPILKVVLNGLGRDPLTTRVSCPQSFGYGGAMGPSQFIPSTWVCYAGYTNSTTGTCLYKTDNPGTWTYNPSKDRIRSLIGGNSPSDPWKAQHAIMGTALLLKDNGAVSGNVESERNAACKYYSGRACAASTNPAVASYGNSVLSHTAGYQANIDFLRSL